jgi:hypothetical protein
LLVQVELVEQAYNLELHLAELKGEHLHLDLYQQLVADMVVVVLLLVVEDLEDLVVQVVVVVHLQLQEVQDRQ